MTDDQILAALDERMTTALTLWGEADSQPLEVRAGVGGSIRNRLAHASRYRATAATYKAVCLAPLQYDCWSKANAPKDYARVMSAAEQLLLQLPVDAILRECLWLADGLISGSLLDRSQGSVFYVETILLSSHPPPWVKSGMHEFDLGVFTFFAEAA